MSRRALGHVLALLLILALAVLAGTLDCLT